MTMIKGDALTQRKCRPCEGIGKPLDAAQMKEYLRQTPGWTAASDGKSIFREYVMKNFAAAVRAVNQAAEIAEAQGHHPDLHLTGYRNLKIVLTTRALGGVSENDFIVAAKINELVT
ncbi:MAG: 4a-hydroxytetrahydrobiopterin dehydratase [Candidatus Omnitrophica bacterium]|nr:4a-hydroxytetrahydrobiopterin dehydratase [Candidatus Omnitrophota bacterium]